MLSTGLTGAEQESEQERSKKSASSRTSLDELTGNLAGLGGNQLKTKLLRPL
jgi:hypothetical protein